ncbi:DoxX family protein [Mesorhizobium sp. SARCC-RB16n]|nr:DoxX family protein [Mesorhizobium sp. SARCC-RB16n]
MQTRRRHAHRTRRKSTSNAHSSTRLKKTKAASSAAAGWAPLPIRLIVGFGFLAHGYAKLSRGPEGFGVVLQTLGVPLPQLLAWLTTLVELVGGGAVLAGVFIPLVSVPMAIVLLTALFTVHSQYGFFSVKFAEVTSAGIRFGPVGYEIILLYLAGLATLAVGGPGRLSLEAVLPRPKRIERSR